MSQSDRALLYQAMASPIGIVLHVSDWQSIMSRFRFEMKKDPTIQGLKFRRTSDPHEMWIIKVAEPSANGPIEDPSEPLTLDDIIP